MTILFCLLAALCEGFDVQAPGVAAAGLKAEFAPTPEWLGILFSASNVGLSIGAIAGGRLADRYGRKAVLVGSLTSFGFCSLLTTLGGSVPALAVLRLVTGLGLGGAMPNVIALAVESRASAARTTRIAVSYLGFPLGAVIASLVMLLAGAAGWRVVFLVGGFLPLAVAAAMAGAMPRTPPVLGREPAATPGVAAELLAPTRWRRTVTLWLGFFLVVLTLHLLLNWLPQLLAGRGLGHGSSLVALIGFNVGGGVMALAMGTLLDSSGRRAALVGCALGLPLSLVALALGPPGAAILVVLSLLLGASVLASQIALYGAAEASYPARARGLGIGAAVGAGRIGSILGPLAAGALIGAGRDPAAVLAGIVPVVAVCSLCVLGLSWRDVRA